MPIEPVDTQRCQAERSNGNTFMTLGGRPGMVRCSNVPKYILRERLPNSVGGQDGEHGAMSVCAECFEVFKKQIGIEKVVVIELRE